MADERSYGELLTAAFDLIVIRDKPAMQRQEMTGIARRLAMQPETATVHAFAHASIVDGDAALCRKTVRLIEITQDMIENLSLPMCAFCAKIKAAQP